MAKQKKSKKETKFCLVEESDLMKCLDEMNVEGREHLKTKLAMVEVLAFVKANPEDKEGLNKLVDKHRL
jgi:hypothetical protein